MKKSHVAFVVAAALIAVVLRLVDRPWMNFSALGALSLMCGAFVRPGWLGLGIVLGCRAFTDAVLEYKTGYGFYSSMMFDYAAYAGIFALGSMLKPKSAASVLATSLMAGSVFFLVSNLGVWLMEHEGQQLYPLTLSGLIECYTKAIPFARGTFVGDVLFSALFFAGLRFVLRSEESSLPVTVSEKY